MMKRLAILRNVQKACSQGQDVEFSLTRYLEVLIVLSVQLHHLVSHNPVVPKRLLPGHILSKRM